MSGSSQEPGSVVGAVLAAKADWGLEMRAEAHGWEAFGRGQGVMVLVKGAILPAHQQEAIR
jgi:hypothetical protein